MSSSPREIVKHKYAQDRFIPSVGEVIIVRLSAGLLGPGSVTGSGTLPSRANHHNYHHAVVVSTYVEDNIVFKVFPMPSYSSADPVTGLSSTRWLLSQPNYFQQLHIPVPYTEDPAPAEPHPLFRTPAIFGNPLEIGGWKDRRPSWILAIPSQADLKFTTTFKSFSPPVKLSMEELRRLKEYRPPIAISSNSSVFSFPPGGGDGAAGGPDVPPPGDDTNRNLTPGQPREDNDGTGHSPGTSKVLQDRGANDSMKHTSANFAQSVTFDSASEDDDDDDDDDNWEDNMDPITFLRYYAPNHPALAKVVQEHDQKMREQVNQGIVNWMEEVQPEDTCLSNGT